MIAGRQFYSRIANDLGSSSRPLDGSAVPSGRPDAIIFRELSFAKDRENFKTMLRLKGRAFRCRAPWLSDSNGGDVS
jgi:hypothetical protein